MDWLAMELFTTPRGRRHYTPEAVTAAAAQPAQQIQALAAVVEAQVQRQARSVETVAMGL
jgi:hypothetical protein